MDQDEITKHLTALTNTVTEVLLWLQTAEREGVLPEGTLGDTHRAAELGRIMSKIEYIRATLDTLEGGDILSLRTSLQDSVVSLEARAAVLRGAADAKA